MNFNDDIDYIQELMDYMYNNYKKGKDFKFLYDRNEDEDTASGIIIKNKAILDEEGTIANLEDIEV